MTIPARLHFCWIGARLSWAYVFALLSAAERSELPEIILHHTDDLEDGPELRALTNGSRIRLSRVDPLACLRQTERLLGLSDELAALFHRLDSPVMRADILRAAILYLEGGVYLDLDTIIIASLRPLLDTTQFVGAEFIVWPQAVRASRSPILWGRHLGLDLTRKILRRLPRGWEMFRRIEGQYFCGVANSAMGAEANSRLFADYLRAMPAAVREGEPAQPYALGPDLLHEVVNRYQHDDLTIQHPHVFYPLPPEISEHWFQIGRGVRLDAVLTAETRVAHWYASVRTKPMVARINPGYVREHRQTQLYSALAWACVPNLQDMS